MFSPSLLLKLIVPYVTALSLIAFALLYAVPKQQKAAFLEDVTGQLKAISQTAAEGVEIAIEEEDFSSLSIINRLLDSNPNVTFAAIYIEEDGHSEQFAIYPSELAEDAAFSVDEDRYLIHKYPVETPLLKGNVWVGYDKTLFEQQTLRINTPVYLSFIFILLILLFSYRTIARSVVKPIREAARAADAMSSGRLESSLDLVSRPDEIGILHKSLQNLQVNLSDQRKENQELMASLEDRVRARTAELQEALATKDTFLTSVSHELRTPLHSIISSLELQQMSHRVDVDEGSSEVIGNGLVAARSLLTLINDLLDYQKFASQGVELHPKAISTLQITEQLERVVAPLFQSGDVHLRSVYANCDDVWLFVDAQRLQQVLVNLVGNACKFTRQGEVVLTSHIEVREGRARCTFAISDTGIGMDEETVRRLGEPFFQSTEGYNREFGGTGLGLSIVKSLLDAMDSKLDVCSEIGRGSTFSFTLDLPLAEEPKGEEDHESSVSPLTENLRILYVEDVEVNQFFMSAMAKRLGVELTVAGSALEGYGLIETQPFDLVLTDIQMPQHDGTELLQWVRENPDIPRDLPIFAFTAHAEDERAEEFSAMGFDYVLTKPLQFKDLVAALQPIKRRAV